MGSVLTRRWVDKQQLAWGCVLSACVVFWLRLAFAANVAEKLS